MGVGGQHHAPAALPPGKTRYPLYRRLGRPQGRSGPVRKISPSPGFDARTVQPVASRYTDWAIPDHMLNFCTFIIIIIIIIIISGRDFGGGFCDSFKLCHGALSIDNRIVFTVMLNRHIPLPLSGIELVWSFHSLQLNWLRHGSVTNI